jgi:esterase/lipase
MRGHGTVGKELAKFTWEDWYESFNRGYAVMRSMYKKVFVCGFSTGGLLALLAAARKKDFPAGYVAINTPLRLKNLASRLIPAVNWWNEVLDSLSVSKGKVEYLNDPPEFPDTNYKVNYIAGVYQLEKLMSTVHEELPKISIPGLVIQGDNDPVVAPVSANLIEKRSGMKPNKLILNRNRHVIVRGNGAFEVYRAVAAYIEELSS